MRAGRRVARDRALPWQTADWQMEPILAQALGAQGARRALENMLAMMKSLQYGWQVTPVDLAG
jgi:hypothetical protein